MTCVPSYYMNSKPRHFSIRRPFMLFVWWALALKFQRWPNLILWFVSGDTRAMLLLPGSPSSSNSNHHLFILSFLALRLFSYQSVANQYHKHVLKTLAFSWIWMSFANIDRSSIIGDAIYYLNELLQRINDLHNELESTPLGFLPQVCSCWDKGRLKDSKHVIDLMKKLYCSTVKREEILSFPLIYKKSFRGKIWISERVFFVFCRKESTGRLMSFFINSPDSHRLMTPGCRALPLANDGSYSTVWPALSLVSPRSSTVVLSSISSGFFR
ncbi:hypothetical protein YC2023_079183 [Brassica napus]